MVSELQTGSRMWAAIEGTLRNDPHRRSLFQRTHRAQMVAVDAKGNEVTVRLLARAKSPSYAAFTEFRCGEQIRVIGPMAISRGATAGLPAYVVIDVDSAVRLEGAERTKHSLFERLTKSFKFWSTK